MTLFSPITLGGRRIPNRLVVAPMTTTQSNPDGSVSEAESAWLERLAKDGYGMTITCAATVSRTATAFHRQLSLADDGYLPGLTFLAERMKRYPTFAIVQLCHGGTRTLPGLTGEPPHSASSYVLPSIPGFVPPRELSTPQIEGIIKDFAAASARAARAGFDGIELHGANGYLFTQFISRMTNLRKDGWGGSLANRARFSREVVRACRMHVPKGFILGFRMSFEPNPWDTGLDLDENIQIMRWLAEDGIDYGHISSMNMFEPSQTTPGRSSLEIIREGIDRNFPLMAAGGVMSREDADRAMDLGADLVAIGRGAIGNVGVPDLMRCRKPLRGMPYDPSEVIEGSAGKELMDYLTTATPISNFGIVKRKD